MTKLKPNTVVKVAGLSALMLLAACSNDQRYKRQVDGDEAYLSAKELPALSVPAGMTLPPANSAYAIAAVSGSGSVGKQLDIRPPAQPLPLLSGARARFSGDSGVLLIEGNHSGLWSQVTDIIRAHHFPIARQDDERRELTTDWVQWSRADEDNQYRGRYQISVQPQEYQQALTVRLLQLQQAGKDVSAPVQRQRYTAQMLNDISAGLDKQETARTNVAGSAGRIDVQSGADDTGLPAIVLRAPMKTVWTRLPSALAHLGMQVSDTDRAKGTMGVHYTALNAAVWRAAGVDDPRLPDGDYRVQIKDLNNRSSVQFMTPQGQALTQSQNDAMVAVLKSALQN